MLGSFPALLLLLGAVPAFPAIVNGKPITEPEVVKAIRDHLRKTSFHRQPSPEQLEVERKEAVEALVREELLAQEARRRGLTVPMAPIEKLAAAEEANAGGASKFEALLASNGIDRGRYLEVIERPVLAKQLVQAEEGRAPEPTREETLAHYRANASRYVVGASAHARELCVRVDPAGSDAEWSEGERRALALRTRLLQGADFAQVAREERCDRFAENGGDLGFVHRGSLEPAMDRTLWALKDGELSGPVRTLRGWHLVRRVETRPERQLPFAEVEEAIRAELREARRKEIVNRLDASLRGKAKVVFAGRG